MVNQRVPTNQDAGWKSSWQFYCGDYTSSSIGTLLMIGSDHDTAGTFDQTLLTLTGGTSNSTRELKVDGKLNVTGTTTFNDITLSGDASFGGSSIVIPTLDDPSDITSNISAKYGSSGPTSGSVDYMYNTSETFELISRKDMNIDARGRANNGTVGSNGTLNLLSGSGGVNITGALTVSSDITTSGDIILDDGGSIKEAGGAAAIIIDAAGEVTQIGQGTPSN